MAPDDLKPITIEGAALTPPQIWEVQDFYARKYLASKRVHVPERRASRQPPPKNQRTWPRTIWPVNDSARVQERIYLKRMQAQQAVGLTSGE